MIEPGFWIRVYDWLLTAFERLVRLRDPATDRHLRRLDKGKWK